MKNADTETIRNEFRRSDEARYIHRLHGVLLVLGGMSSGEAGRLLHDPQRTVAHWAMQFKERGLEGLREIKRSGRPAALGARQRDALKAALMKSPRSAGLDGAAWTGDLLSKFVRKRYGIKLTMRHCRRLLRALEARLS